MDRIPRKEETENFAFAVHETLQHGDENFAQQSCENRRVAAPIPQYQEEEIPSSDNAKEINVKLRQNPAQPNPAYECDVLPFNGGTAEEWCKLNC